MPQANASTPTVSQFLNAANWEYQQIGQPADLRPFEVGGRQLSIDDTDNGIEAHVWLTPAGQVIISYQGTQFVSLVEFLEDPAISFQQIIEDVAIAGGRVSDSQEIAAQFARQVVEAAQAQGIVRENVFVTGHSLGGIQAAYAAQQTGLGGIGFEATGIPRSDTRQGDGSNFVSVVQYGDSVGNYASDIQSEQPFAPTFVEGGAGALPHYGYVAMVGDPNVQGTLNAGATTSNLGPAGVGLTTVAYGGNLAAFHLPGNQAQSLGVELTQKPLGDLVGVMSGPVIEAADFTIGQLISATNASFSQALPPDPAVSPFEGPFAGEAANILNNGFSLEDIVAGLVDGTSVLGTGESLAGILVPGQGPTVVQFFDYFFSDNLGIPQNDFDGFIQWTVANGSVDLVGGIGPGVFGAPPDEPLGRYVDLGGSTGDPGLFETRLAFPVVAGQAYNLTFDYRSTEGDLNNATAFIGDQVFTVSSDDTSFQRFSTNFTANETGLVRIAFQGDESDLDGSGIGIDGILFGPTLETGNDFSGGPGDDVYTGTSGSGTIRGNGGDDILTGGGGDDTIDGGEGFDTAIFTTSFADTLLVQGGETTIFDGANGRDTLTNIDRLEFTDITIEFQPEVYGELQTGTDSDGVQVAALFDGILGREVDSSGLQTFVNVLESGGTAEQVADALLNSEEYTLLFGDVDAETNEGFVNEIYQIALGRAPDQGGFDAAVAALEAGTSRAEIAANISLSEENFAGLTVDETGIVVPDADAAAAARLYFGLLDRAPDTGGLANFAAFLDAGGTATQAAQFFLDSQEYQAKFDDLSDEDFVEELYENGLGREPDAGGFEAYTSALESGTSRAEVAAAITQSTEAEIRFAPIVDQGWVIV